MLAAILMFHFSNSPVLFDQAAILLVSCYIVIAICYNVTYSVKQQLALPLLNGLNLATSAFVFATCFCHLPVFDVTSLEHFWITTNWYVNSFQFILFLVFVIFICICKEYAKAKKVLNFEYDILLCFVMLALLLLNFCTDFLSFYIAIELQSLSFYVLATFNKQSEFCCEAGLKYFILGAFSSGLLLFGFVLFYLTFGSICFETIAQAASVTICLTAFTGVLFFFAALFFKIGVFPFHFWICDVYDGSAINVTAFFAVIPKLILLAFLLRSSFLVFSTYLNYFSWFFLFCGLGSICFAAIAALFQKRLKRLLAYSAVSHSGFIILGIGCSNLSAIKASTIYIVLYSFTSMAVFALLFLVNLRNLQPKFLINWSGSFSRNATLSISLVLLLYSLAGIPPFSGFFAKLGILFCLMSKSHFFTALITVFFSCVGCFYYIRLVKILSFVKTENSSFWLGVGSKSIEFYLAFLIIVLSAFLLRPNFLVNIAALAALSLA